MEITKEQIAEWKKEHGKIFKIEPVTGLVIIYRTLTRGMYMDLMAQQMEGLIGDPEIETVKQCIVNKIDDEVFQSLGGVATVIYEDIMRNSGFSLVESEEL